jgi:hypothetical protein
MGRPRRGRPAVQINILRMINSVVVIVGMGVVVVGCWGWGGGRHEAGNSL